MDAICRFGVEATLVANELLTVIWQMLMENM